MYRIFAAALLALFSAACFGAPGYTVSSGSLFSFTPASAPTLLTLGDNELSTLQSPAGFSFTYFGQAYTGFQVGSNGYIIMGGGGTTVASQPSHAVAPGRVLAPFWGDMRPNLQGQIGWTFANNKLTVEWLGVRLATATAQGGPYNVQIQIVLDTTSGQIDFLYGDYGGFGIGPGSPWDYSCAISGPSGAGQAIVPGNDGSFISSTGKITLWPLLRYTRFVPVASVNNLPVIAVTLFGAQIPVTQGATASGTVPYTMLTLAPRISVSDADGDTVSLTGTVSDITTEGVLNSEFSSASAAVPYTLTPATGVFNRAVVTHTVLLIADDGHGGNAQFVFYIKVNGVPGNGDPVVDVSAGGASVTDGGNLNVAFGATLASLNLQIGIDDPEGDASELTATISNQTTQGLLVSEFENGHVAVPYALAPSSGTFNQGGTTHQVVLTADDYRGGLLVFTFNIIVGAAPANNAPTLAVTAMGVPLGNGATLNVGYNTTLAALNLSIAVNDPDSDATSVSGAVSNVGASGLLASEFSSAVAGVPYALVPQSGVFNASKTTHLVSLVAQDGLGGQATFTFSIVVGAAPGDIGSVGGGGGGCTAGDESGELPLIAVMLLSVFYWVKRRKLQAAMVVLAALVLGAGMFARTTWRRRVVRN